MKLETLVFLKGIRDQHLANAAALSEVIDAINSQWGFDLAAAGEAALNTGKAGGGEDIPPKPAESSVQTDEQKPSAFVKYDGE